MQNEIRVVVDTNVLISSVLSSKGKPNRVVKTVLFQGVLLFSQSTFEEAETRLLLPKFERYVNPGQVNDFLNFLRGTAQFIKPEITIAACRDADDNRFLELAVDGKADVIVTGDKDLLALHPFQGIPILNPASFLEYVED